MLEVRNGKKISECLQKVFSAFESEFNLEPERRDDEKQQQFGERSCSYDCE